MAIRSMTGYGQAAAELGDFRLNVELRTVNGRYAELRMRVPNELADQEAVIRRTVLGRIRRGRIQLNVAVENTATEGSGSSFNRRLMADLIAAGRAMRDEFGVRGDLDVKTAVLVPGMFRSDGVDVTWGESERATLKTALDDALEALQQDREREGANLQREMVQRIDAISSLTVHLRARAEQLPDRVREKLVERLGKLSGDIELEPARVAQEAVVIADRADVTEEIVRLEGHLEQAAVLMSGADEKPLGKRAEFLIQEIHRETNTINSKASDLELSRIALAIKTETEKVREQIQNVE